ncbi:HAD domain-containing protein [Nannocystis punicea]|uniref:HAD domain-containing protein n=1 Tax=Nannocystis punicea TaxID=2995304 RepID=A0ABY7HG32_9BACT|nr:HAD domain-containing protein [Nannocystis poenicansa]WAS98257.1 HAD domain-containing protein [Nannocystis poenicansa]
MPDRVLFLDIDGVMNTLSSPVDPAIGLTSLLLPGCVAALNRVVQATGAVVVVTSTWRLTMPLAELRAHFRAAGCVAEIVDVTPDLDAPRRDREIAAWLAAQAEPPRAYCILDDDRDMDGLPGRLVRTDSRRGLGDDELPRVLALLAE